MHREIGDGVMIRYLFYGVHGSEFGVWVGPGPRMEFCCQVLMDSRIVTMPFKATVKGLYQDLPTPIRI